MWTPDLLIRRKFLPVHAMKIYRRVAIELHAFPCYYMRMNVSGKIHSPFASPLGKHPFCPSTSKLGKPRCRSGRVKEEKAFLSLLRYEPRILGRRAFTLFTNRTKLSRLMLDVVVNIKFRLSHMESNSCRPAHSPPVHCLYLKRILISITLNLTFIEPFILIYFYRKTNQMHHCLNFFLFWNNTLHVSDSLSVHHQEFKTVHTASGICQTDSADTADTGTSRSR